MVASLKILVTKMKTQFTLFISLALLIVACKPYQADDIELGGNLPQVSFNWSFVPGDSNRIALESTGETGFLLNWDYGNGQSGEGVRDTAYFPAAGEYTIRLTVANRAGTGFAAETVFNPVI